MKRLLLIGKWFLIIWGAISLIAVIGFGGFVVYGLAFGNKDEIDSASAHDVRFVLNCCNLGDSRIEKVVRSYESARSFTGDGLDAYAIKISHVTLEELTATNTDNPTRRWYRGDQLSNILDDAVTFVGPWLPDKKISWFPKEAELKSNQFYIYLESIYYTNVRPTAVDLIFVRPSDKMVFYFSAKL